jgi:hypothetical protein
MAGSRKTRRGPGSHNSLQGPQWAKIPYYAPPLKGSTTSNGSWRSSLWKIFNTQIIEMLQSFMTTDWWFFPSLCSNSEWISQGFIISPLSAHSACTICRTCKEEQLTSPPWISICEQTEHSTLRVPEEWDSSYPSRKDRVKNDYSGSREIGLGERYELSVRQSRVPSFWLSGSRQISEGMWQMSWGSFQCWE